MLICMDFDNTYTKDKTLFDSFIKFAQELGHEVICCTMRKEEEGEWIEETIGNYCKVYYSDRQAKKPYLESIDIFPDIWIEDKPEFILMDAADVKDRPGFAKEE